MENYSSDEYTAMDIYFMIYEDPTMEGFRHLSHSEYHSLMIQAYNLNHQYDE